MIPSLTLLVILSQPAFVVLDPNHAHMEGVCWRWKNGRESKRSDRYCKDTARVKEILRSRRHGGRR